jgi:SAM-dependent methyltransferase
MGRSDRYSYDDADGVLVRVDQAVVHEYTDGPDVEDYILESIRTSSDITSGSDELVRRIRDWPSEYHFSASRSTLLAPFELSGLTVLEVGSGCGAITRALGELGAHVVALEGSRRRAHITAARCRDLDQVTVVCDDFRDFQPAGTFDVVLLVGVLEYAPRYFPGRDPLKAALDKARSCLGDEGAVVVAIENQLGLKYFAGASEDHHGQAFFGIEDRYDETPGPRTLGRNELRRLLGEAGFAKQAWYYPFPDYKLPRLVLTDRGLQDSRLPAGRLAGGLSGRDYVWPHPEIFAEDAAWEVVGRNELIADLSNSFLVAASPCSGSKLLERPGWLAELHTSHRVRAFRTITRFAPGTDGLNVSKVPAHERAGHVGGAPVRLVRQEVSPLLPGAPLEARLRRLLRAPDVDLAMLSAVLRPWVQLLRTSIPEKGSSLLPGHLLDLLPRNLMEPPDRPLRGLGQVDLTPFDLEWEYLPPLELDHVLFRGLAPLLLSARGRARLGEGATTGGLVGEMAAHYGASLAEDRVTALIEREAAVQSAVFGMDEQATHDRMGTLLEEPFEQASPLAVALGLRDDRIRDLMLIVAERDARVAELDNRAVAQDERIAALQSLAADQEGALAARAEAIEALSQQIKAVEASSSWKLTAPLRRLRRGS